jgi:site-specific DNA recombinase
MISADLIGCSTARNKGTCENRRNIQRDGMEGRVLNALRYHLMDPALFREFCDEFTRELNRLRMEGSASLEATRSELKRIERELDTLLKLILQGGAADRINAKTVLAELMVSAT